MFRQVVRKGDLTVRVESVDKAEKDVNHIVEDAGGFTETTSSKDLAEHPVMNMVLRVPSPSFEDVLTQFEGLGVRLAKSVQTQDVTGQLAAIADRLQELKAREAELQDLKNRPKTKDEGSIDRQLAEVHRQIANKANDLKTQSGIAALSTITLTLEQGAVAGSSGNDPKWLAESFGEATGAAGTVFRALVTMTLWAVVFAPLWIPAAFLLWRFGPRRRAAV